ncbi:hypothetical protein P879_01943 [Paragonimus westermani]|uniref:Ig-like domain-containing protein n=1 Tax=Paragonimus westermani TaxID=34504 RepID=A0A8T0DUD2_9TREM|nr:hypothetical protein P879_01943 [Paragonimus westermani]
MDLVWVHPDCHLQSTEEDTEGYTIDVEGARTRVKMKRKANDRTVTSVTCTDELSEISDSEETLDEKIQILKSQLKQLDEKTHPEYLKVKRKAECWLAEEKQRVHILHENRLEIIYREYKKETEACDRDCELEKRRIQDYLVSLCEELKRRLEHDKKNIELTPSGDILDFKPAVTRKLRRRAGAELPTTASTTFMYWGDLLLCGSAWPLNTTNYNRTNSTEPHPNAELRSPVPSNGVDGHPDTATSAPNDTEYSDSSKPTRTHAANLKETAAPTATTPSHSSTRHNLFGSLGLNLFDGSLLSHLLASINGSGIGLNSSGSCIFGNSSGTGFSNVYNCFTGPPAGSAAAAVAAGLMLMPSNSASGGLAAALGSVANSLTGVPQSTTKKRRQQNAIPIAQLNLLLPENDIYADLTVIHRACAKAAAASGAGATTGSRKHSQHNSSTTGPVPVIGSPSHSSGQSGGEGSASTKGHKEVGTPTLSSPGSGYLGSPNVYSGELSTLSCRGTGLTQSGGSAPPGPSVWIDDGRLYYGQKCFQYGASVILEGREGSSHRCTGTIAAIGAQDVAIRRCSDHGICRVTVQQLKQGRYALWPGKST